MDFTKEVIFFMVVSFLTGGAIFGSVTHSIVFKSQQDCEKMAHHSSHKQFQEDEELKLAQKLDGIGQKLSQKFDVDLEDLKLELKQSFEELKKTLEIVREPSTTIPPGPKGKIGKKR